MGKRGLILAMIIAVGACTNGTETSITTASEGPAESSAPTPTTPLASEVPTTSPPTDNTEVDACVLVDAADAESVLGAPATMDPAPVEGFGATSICSWETEDLALLVVSVFEGLQFYGGDVFSGGEPLDFGDDGYIGVDPNFGGVDMQVVKDMWVVSLSAAPFAIADVEGLPAAMTLIAQQAINRLP